MRYLCFVLMIFFMASCNKEVVFQEKKDIANETWAYNDTLRFKVEVKDTTGFQTVELNIGYQPTYAYQNIYTQISTTFPDGTTKTAMKSFDLFDNLGNSLGKCSGKDCLLEIVLQEKAKFSQPGTYTFSFVPFMRMDTVGGVRFLEMQVKNLPKK